MIEINQDPLGIQATCVKNCCSKGLLGGLYTPLTCLHFQNAWQVWSGPLLNGDHVVVIVNRFDHDVNVEIDWQHDANIPHGIYEVRDLWNHKSLGIINTNTSPKASLGHIGYHDNRAFRLYQRRRILP